MNPSLRPPPLPESLPDRLPDYRNLGVVMRILLAVNASMLILSIAATDTLADAGQRFFAQASILEPALLLVVGTLALLSPLLAQLDYWRGVLCSMAVSIGLTLLLYSFTRLLFDPEGLALPKIVAFATGSTWILLAYFRLRGRALSPLLAEARLQALQARIRPHFLFNSLNAVLSLIRTEPRQAERALEDLADLFRVFMAENTEFSTLAREMALARQYLDIEALRLGTRLQLEWHIDKMPGEALIPPLVIQPLLENAVYHGIEPSSQPGVINVNVFRVRDEVHIDIRNPYASDDGHHHAGNKMAMRNIRERLFLHFDAEANLKTAVGSDYYQVHLILPYRSSREARHE